MAVKLQSLSNGGRSVLPWRLAVVLALALGLALPELADAAERKTPRKSQRSTDNAAKVYRWVDEDGTVHFGDQVPPEYAPVERQVLNQYGVPLKTEKGLLTEEDVAAEKKAAAERAAAIAAARRDEVLLSTYLSVEEIEALRNRRVELIDGQISVTENYLASLREKLQQLQAEASGYKPYSTDPDAEPLDEKLALEITDTMDSIALYERTLADTRNRQGRVMLTFNADIARFRELKGL